MSESKQLSINDYDDKEEPLISPSNQESKATSEMTESFHFSRNTLIMKAEQKICEKLREGLQIRYQKEKQRQLS